MASNTRKIAELLGAEVLGTIEETGGGAFGAARLAKMMATLQQQSTTTFRDHHAAIPISEATARRLARLAAQASREGRSITPMQVAAQILEDAFAGIPD